MKGFPSYKHGYSFLHLFLLFHVSQISFLSLLYLYRFLFIFNVLIVHYILLHFYIVFLFILCSNREFVHSLISHIYTIDMLIFNTIWIHGIYSSSRVLILEEPRIYIYNGIKEDMTKEQDRA